MRLINLYIQFVQRWLPTPFSIAVLLSFLTFGLVWVVTTPESTADFYPIQILSFWEMGFWELLSFSMQMSLILLLGHTLALTKAAGRLISHITKHCTTTAGAAFLVSFTAIGLSFINWGLCLVFGAILARKVAENAAQHNIQLNYPLIAAAGYSGMMAWHGGFSGSAPLTVAESTHFLSEQMGTLDIEHTILSLENLITYGLVLLIIPVFLYVLGKKIKSTPFALGLPDSANYNPKKQEVKGAERLDHSRIPALLFGIIILFLAFTKARLSIQSGNSFVDLNFVNLLLFGAAILLHGNFHRFQQAVSEAIGGVSAIVIQFPIYAGIMGMMKYSGIVELASVHFTEFATINTLPIFTFMSAAFVNIFIPSGGGQWAIQGPVLIEAATALNIPLSKIIMAFSYGDQLTNMLQPFWALPLLGITKLKAKDILPFSALIMVLGVLIYCCALLFIY